MIAEILATGDEIRSGALIDSNSAYIAEKLEEVGIPVIRHSCVGDDLEALISILKEISTRVDICVVTGGLGPTADDLSSVAAAAAAGETLILDPKRFLTSRLFSGAASGRWPIPTKSRPCCLVQPRLSTIPSGRHRDSV